MRYVAPILGLILFGAAADPAAAQPYRAREGVRSGDVQSLDEILNGIRRERPGNLADVQGPDYGPAGEPHYRLKWVTPDGRVLWLDTDARTGRVLGVQGDDRGGPFGPAGRFQGRRFGPQIGPNTEPNGGPPDTRPGRPAGPPPVFPGSRQGPQGERGGPRGDGYGGGFGRFRFGR